MASKVKNVTFSLPAELIEKLKEFAEDKYIPSINAGVREALEQYSVKLEKEKLRQKMAEAAKDPLFMEDLEDSMKAFAACDSETAGRLEEW